MVKKSLVPYTPMTRIYYYRVEYTGLFHEGYENYISSTEVFDALQYIFVLLALARIPMIQL